MNTINSISQPIGLTGSPAAGAKPSDATASFKSFLTESIQEVNSMQQAADQAVEALASGEEISPAEVLTAVQKADIAFRLMMQMRNKMVAAYQEIQNIRV